MSDLHHFQPLRELLSEKFGRLETYGHVEFRSKLEARFARHLDDRGEAWTYEPRTFHGAGPSYLPDFELTDADPRIFIEVKPTLAEVEAAKAKMEVIWETYPDALLIVACGEECRYFGAMQGLAWTTWVERWPA